MLRLRRVVLPVPSTLQVLSPVAATPAQWTRGKPYLVSWNYTNTFNLTLALYQSNTPRATTKQFKNSPATLKCAALLLATVV